MSGERAALNRLERGLPARWFDDPAHYARELAAFWYRHWIACLREEEIPAAGDYRRVTIGTQSLVIVRAEDGAIRGYHNVCRHRGSVLVTGDAGRFAGEQITCPYHAWTYDLAGALVLTPRRIPTADFDARRFPLYRVHTDTWGGFVFVHLGERPKPLATALGSVATAFERHELARLRSGRRILREVGANWKLLAENFAECFHCPPVHPELCRIVTAYRDGGAWGLRSKDEFVSESRYEYLPGAETLTLDGTARIPPLPRLNAAERARLYAPATVLPNLFLNVHPDYVHTHMMFPTGPTGVSIVYDWLFAPESMPQGTDLDHYVALWERTNAQDARNCEWQQAGIRAAPFEHGWYVPQEFDCHRFAQWVRRGLKGSARAGGGSRARR